MAAASSMHSSSACSSLCASAGWMYCVRVQMVRDRGGNKYECIITPHTDKKTTTN